MTWYHASLVAEVIRHEGGSGAHQAKMGVRILPSALAGHSGRLCPAFPGTTKIYDLK